MRTAINLYSVRDLEEPMAVLLERVAAAGYDGVQFSGGLRGASPGMVRDTLDEVGLAATPAHVGIGQLEEELDETAASYGETLGCDGAVVPALGEENFESPVAVDAAARRLSDLAARLDDRGWRLHYHNHAFEFTDLDGATAFDRFVDRAGGVGVELDVGWALAGGEAPAALLARLDDRVDLVHMKDVEGDTHAPCEIGEGVVDMQACADAAREVDADWLVYEHDTPVDPARSIEVGAEYFASL